jgi:hypothetical protein
VVGEWAVEAGSDETPRTTMTTMTGRRIRVLAPRRRL